MYRTLQILLYVLLLSIISCARETPLSKRDLARMHVKVWQLSELRSNNGDVVSAKQVCEGVTQIPKIDFDIFGNFKGNICCNDMSGKYETNDDGSLIIKDIMITQVHCPNLTGIDDWKFMKLLSSARRVMVDDMKLTISLSSGDNLIYEAS